MGLLAQCMRGKGIVLAGLQEARTPEGAVTSNDFLGFAPGLISLTTSGLG